MNIDSLILSVIVMVITAAGFVWGYKWGFGRGYKAGFDKSIINSPLSEIKPFPIFERQMQRYDCIVRLPGSAQLEDWLFTKTVTDISEKIARQLLINRVIRPVIINPAAGTDCYSVDIGASIYACSNPDFEKYPRLVFLDPAPLDEDNSIPEIKI